MRLTYYWSFGNMTQLLRRCSSSMFNIFQLFSRILRVASLILKSLKKIKCWASAGFSKQALDLGNSHGCSIAISSFFQIYNCISGQNWTAWFFVDKNCTFKSCSGITYMTPFGQLSWSWMITWMYRLRSFNWWGTYHMKLHLLLLSSWMITCSHRVLLSLDESRSIWGSGCFCWKADLSSIIMSEEASVIEVSISVVLWGITGAICWRWGDGSSSTEWSFDRQDSDLMVVFVVEWFR